MSSKCPMCGSSTDQRCFEHVTQVGDLKVADKTAVLPVCASCGTAIISSQQMERYELKAAQVALREAEHVNGRALRFVRKALGLKQRELGHHLGVSEFQISRWENSGPIDRRLRLAMLGLVELALDGAPVELAANQSGNLEVTGMSEDLRLPAAFSSP